MDKKAVCFIFTLLFSAGVDQFSVYISFKPDSDWIHVLTANLPSAINVACVNIPLNTYNINHNGRYAKLDMETAHLNKQIVLAYVNINYNYLETY